MIRRGGVTDVPWFLAPVGNKVSRIYSTLHRVVIMAESYHKPHRKFGVSSSRRLGIRVFAN